MKSNAELEKEIEELKEKMAEMEAALCEKYKEISVIQLFIKNQIADNLFIASMMSKDGVKSQAETEFYQEHVKEIHNITKSIWTYGANK